MKINRLFVTGLAALALLASCKKENNNTAAGGPGFKAVIEHNGDGSRTYLDGDLSVDGWDNQVKWMEGDIIRVANAAGESLEFEIAEGDSTMTGNFYNGGEHDAFFQPDYTALYPSTNADGVANTIDANGIATFTLPATQTLTATGTFANKAMPMVAHSSSQTLPFKNVLGGLIIPLVGDGTHVTSLVLTSVETTDKLWGTYTADCNSDDPVPAYKENGGGDHHLTLSCDVTLDANTPNYFVFMLPPGTLSKGFTLEVYDGATKLYDQTANWSASPVLDFIPRSVLRKVSSNIEVSNVVPPPADLVVTTISPTFISTNSAYGKGTVSGGIAIECGLCWKLGTGRPENDVPEVTVENDYTITATAGENFAITFTEGLVKDNVYWVRAWARNAAGNIYYGDPIPFATRKDYANDYNGRLPYQFSVSSTKKVYFSMGNLQWSNNNGATHATTTGTAPGTWRFAEYQFEYVGDDETGNVFANGEHPDASLNGMKSSNMEKQTAGAYYNGWYDLFGFATSGYQQYSNQTHYQPWDYFQEASQNTAYTGYGPAQKASGMNWNTFNLVGYYAKCDWGVFNAISNGGNTPGQWRVMTGPSWQGTVGQNNGGCTQQDGENQWLLAYRTVSYARFGYYEMNVRNDQVVRGAIIYPDVYSLPWEFNYNHSTPINDVLYGGSSNWPTSYANNINEAQWSLLEYKGAMFWPASGNTTEVWVSQGEWDYRIEKLGVLDGVMNWTSSRYVNENNGYDRNPGLARHTKFPALPSAEPYLSGAFVRGKGMAVRLVQDAN